MVSFFFQRRLCSCFLVGVFLVYLFAPVVFAETLVQFPFEAYKWNEDRKQLETGQVVARVYSGWRNYFTGTSWEKIDLMPVDTGSGIVVNQAPYTFIAPKTADGEFIFKNDGMYDRVSDSFLDTLPLVNKKVFKEVEPVAAQSVDGGILYENAFLKYGADLFIKFGPASVQFLVKLDQLPPESMKGHDVVACFSNVFTGDLETRVVETFDRVVYDSSSPPKREKIQFVNGCKVISWSFLESATFPVFADDVVSVDAEVNDESMFSTSRAGAGLSLDGAGNESGYAVRWTSSNFFRYWADFDTSGVNGTITAASLNLNYTQTNAALTRTLDVVKSRKAASALDTSDWNNIGDTGVGSGTIFGIITRASLEGTGWEVATLTDFTGIVLEGTTKLALVDDLDWLNGSDSAGSTGTQFSTGDSADQPYLEVTFTPDGGGTSGGSGTGLLLLTQSGSNFYLNPDSVLFFVNVWRDIAFGSVGYSVYVLLFFLLFYFVLSWLWRVLTRR